VFSAAARKRYVSAERLDYGRKFQVVGAAARKERKCKKLEEEDERKPQE